MWRVGGAVRMNASIRSNLKLPALPNKQEAINQPRGEQERPEEDRSRLEVTRNDHTFVPSWPCRPASSPVFSLPTNKRTCTHTASAYACAHTLTHARSRARPGACTRQQTPKEIKCDPYIFETQTSRSNICVVKLHSNGLIKAICWHLNACGF